MLFYWLKLALRKIVWLFRAPTQQEIARVDLNLACPVCGGRSGSLRCVSRTDKPTPEDGGLNPELFSILCQHTCNICGAVWYEKPILKQVNVRTVLPSVARTDLEAREDKRVSAI